MPALRLIAPCALSLLLAACGSSPVGAPPTGFEHAAAVRNCGPADGPAVSIYLAAAPVESLQPSPPYVQINLWQPLERVADRAWALTDGLGEAAAIYVASGEGHEMATGGRLSVTGVTEDTTLTGSVRIEFPSAGRIDGDFSARWFHRAMLCG